MEAECGSLLLPRQRPHRDHIAVEGDVPPREEAAHPAQIAYAEVTASLDHAGVPDVRDNLRSAWPPVLRYLFVNAKRVDGLRHLMSLTSLSSRRLGARSCCSAAKLAIRSSKSQAVSMVVARL
ncbi:predicted protein [Streptomyces viridosporus ATCC 14672]|uniref:Predicted protein n=1 Tax=Streptomyces viridosporus (strain ATCC 14672 / DSM 40746 / JCM 4963 / KCTC 9882 / NRRL B-12104 / FH 1290) TaxID=566461 RepID=D5ZQC4_STRV1|nr:predicted protein [Streptomyces viridosporus ATCC 14672]